MIASIPCIFSCVLLSSATLPLPVYFIVPSVSSIVEMKNLPVERFFLLTVCLFLFVQLRRIFRLRICGANYGCVVSIVVDIVYSHLAHFTARDSFFWRSPFSGWKRCARWWLRVQGGLSSVLTARSGVFGASVNVPDIIEDVKNSLVLIVSFSCSSCHLY